MNQEVSATKLDIFNYHSLQSGTKAQVKVGEFVFESHSVQHLSLNDNLINLGIHDNQVSIFKVSTCGKKGGECVEMVAAGPS